MWQHLQLHSMYKEQYHNHACGHNWPVFFYILCIHSAFSAGYIRPVRHIPLVPDPLQINCTQIWTLRRNPWKEKMKVDCDLDSKQKQRKGGGQRSAHDLPAGLWVIATTVLKGSQLGHRAEMEERWSAKRISKSADTLTALQSWDRWNRGDGMKNATISTFGRVDHIV